MPQRAELAQVIGPFSPRTLGSRFSVGTKTPSIAIPRVMEVRWLNLPSINLPIRKIFSHMRKMVVKGAYELPFRAMIY